MHLVGCLYYSVYYVQFVLELYETQRHEAIWSVGGVAECILNHGGRWW